MIAHRWTLPDMLYAGAVEAGSLLPANAAWDAPEIIPGFVPHRTGDAWEQVEDHRGKEGYVNGEPYTIRDAGPYPDGWSDTPPPPPPPTPEEIAARERARILARLAEIDADSVRPLRAIAQGDAVTADTEKLAALDAEAAALREELADLPVA